MMLINEFLHLSLYSVNMIKLLQEGTYSLLETKGQTKILTLDKKQVFAWVHAKDIGEILVTSHKLHKSDHMLAIGKYRIYEIDNEPNLTDLIHLELLLGDGTWQGYLLLTGLPSDKDKRTRIIPTDEIITKAIL